MHRKSNSLADSLANTGVACNQSLVEGLLNYPFDDTLKLKCRQIARKYLSSLDAGASEPDRQRGARRSVYQTRDTIHSRAITMLTSPPRYFMQTKEKPIVFSLVLGWPLLRAVPLHSLWV